MSKTMSTPSAVGSDAGLIGVEPRPSLFTRFLHAMMKARQEQARRYVKAYLARCSDEQLKSMGYTEAEIRQVRRHRNLAMWA
jgi:uncharacterized protein YjiS (DUF1127 family)